MPLVKYQKQIYFTLFLIAALLLQLSNYNQILFTYLNHELSSIESIFWQLMTVLGDAWIALVLIFVLTTIKPEILKPSLIAIFLAILVTYSLKSAFHIPRPAAILSEDSIFIVGKLLQAHNSFPSGHTLTAFVTAGIIAFPFRLAWLTISLFALASLAGISRIMVGAHWPADILLGGLIGWMIAFLAYWIANKMDKKTTNKKLGLISRLILLALTALMFTHDTHYPAGNILMYIIASFSVLWMTFQVYHHTKKTLGYPNKKIIKTKV